MWFVVAVTAKQDLPSGFQPECYSVTNGWNGMITDRGEKKSEILHFCWFAIRKKSTLEVFELTKCL